MQSNDTVPIAALSLKERQQLLAMYADLRVSDVRDGMDMCNLRHTGSLPGDIRAIGSHRICGFAITARYVPFTETVQDMSENQFKQWAEIYKRDVAPRPWQDVIQKHDIVIIDQIPPDVGILGSRNILRMLIQGASGFITNGGIRDIDDLKSMQVPLWIKNTAQSMVQGRTRLQSWQKPIVMGSTTIRPSDVIVADGDGVIVVPLEEAERVARLAKREQEEDNRIRESLIHCWEKMR